MCASGRTQQYPWLQVTVAMQSRRASGAPVSATTYVSCLERMALDSEPKGCIHRRAHQCCSFLMRHLLKLSLERTPVANNISCTHSAMIYLTATIPFVQHIWLLEASLGTMQHQATF